MPAARRRDPDQPRVFAGFCRDSDDTAAVANPTQHFWENGAPVGVSACAGVFNVVVDSAYDLSDVQRLNREREAAELATLFVDVGIATGPVSLGVRAANRESR